MDIRIFTEPQQGATYDQLLAVALEAERLGFGAFFRSDHYLHMGDGGPGPGSTDAWTTLAGLARDTSTIRLGTLVTSATFRLPGPLAVTVATVDAMSGGRVELGLGAGWYDDEHRAFAIPFPGTGERFDRLEEQFEILTGLWATEPGGTFEHHGDHYELTGGTGLPKPTQTPHPPIIVGGFGAKRTPALAARFAQEFNAPFADPDVTAMQFDRVRAACEAADRDPSSLTWSAAQVACVGTDDAEVARRAEAIGREPSELRQHGVAGTPDEARARLAALADAGVERVYLQILDLADLDHLGLIASELA